MPIAEPQPSSETASFAGLLAALAARRSGPRSGQSSAQSAGQGSWIDELEEDVATLSYEHALQRHGAAPASGIATANQDSVANTGAPAFSPLFQPEEAAGDAPRLATEAPYRKRQQAAAAGDELRKRASVTVRMSRAECLRMQQRAAEAGLTVSAYLRSCAFEVETLRAQVKQTLTELRAAQPVSRSTAHWWQRFVHHAATKLK
jgi:hypothetical protein